MTTSTSTPRSRAGVGAGHRAATTITRSRVTGRPVPADVLEPGPSSRRRKWQLFSITIAAFLWASGPTVVNLVVGGRLPANATSTGRVATTGLGTASELPFVGLFAVVALAIFVANITDRRSKLPSFLPITLFVAFFLTITFDDFVNSAGSDIRFAPVIVVAMVPVIWSIRLRFEDLQVLGYVGVLVCLSSLLLIPLGQGWMLADDVALSEKAFIGSRVLGGLFAQSNILGMAIAALLPFCFLMKHRSAVVLSFLLLIYTAVLSASRTSLVAIGISSVVMFVALMFRSRGALKWVLSLSLIAISVGVIAVPLTTTDPAAYTNRGRIWQLAIDQWGDFTTAVFGDGLSSFGIGSDIALGIGAPSYHGHNQFVSLLTMSGAICVIAFVLVIGFALRGSFSTTVTRHVRVVGYFLLMIIAVGIAETPLRTDTVDALPWATWLPLIAIICAGTNVVEVAAPEIVEPMPTIDKRIERDRSRMGVATRR
ncbi:O-antigen ligase family protein [Microbacteriaceae bacterium VKM Ac-2855]|nr:O-antigen ligase family protein [Microbacteriaceae bacterium VKM Ac-2855]